MSLDGFVEVARGAWVRALDSNPFTQAQDADSYRRWAACAAVCDGTVATMHHAAVECTISRLNHAAVEGHDYDA